MVNATERKATAAEKRKKALDLRRAGWSYQDIADEVGWANKGTAYTNVQNAIREITRESATELLELELARLDDLQAGAYEAARNGDLYAVDRVLKIIDARAKFLGLYERKQDDGAAEVRGAIAGLLASMSDALKGDNYGQVTDDSSGTEHVPGDSDPRP